MAVTTWNTVPDYDQWGRDTYWNADDWITWHKLLKQHFGQDRANIIWNYAYAQGGIIPKHYDYRTFNSNFRSYAKSQDLDTYASVGLPLIPQLLDVTGSAFDLIGGVTNTVSQVADGFSNPKFIRILMYTALFAGVGYLGFRGYVFYKVKMATIK
jgi:hypothetical protein